MFWHDRTLTFVAILAGLLLSGGVRAQSDISDEKKIDLSVRANSLVSDGSPAKNVLGVGVIGRYYLDNGWFAGATLDTYDYDYEDAASLVGIAQDPGNSEIDATASNTVLSGFVGRLYGNRNNRFDWFWSAGVGVGFPEIQDFSGNVEGGGNFDLRYDAKTELHLMGALGTSYHFTPTWSATFAARLEHHFMDVTSTDVLTGSTHTIDSQSPVGAYLSIDFRF